MQNFDLKIHWLFNVYNGDFRFCSECSWGLTSYVYTYPAYNDLSNAQLEKKSCVRLCPDGCYYCPTKLGCLANTADYLDKTFSVCYIKSYDSKI